MVRLADWPADTGLQCPGRWLAFRCTAKTPGGEHARRMFDSVREALADGQPLALRVTDDERVRQFCVVTRISVPASPGDKEDSDGDGVADLEDDVPLNASETVDWDDDGLGNHADPDDDNDGVDDHVDAFPFDPFETADTDGGGLGDNADADDDNDGVPDADDAFPLDPNEWTDTDGDGIGDNAAPPPSGFPLLDGVGSPRWMARVGDTFHVVDGTGVYAYGPSGQRRNSSEFPLDRSNRTPSGIAFGRGLFFVLDREEGRVFAYGRSGVRRAEADIVLRVDPEDDGPAGLAFADGVLYLGLNSRVQGYAVGGQRVPGADLDLGALGRVDSIQGMTYSDSTDTLYVKVATGLSENAVLAFPQDGEPYVFRLPYSVRTDLRGLAAHAGRLFVGGTRSRARHVWAYWEPTEDAERIEADDARSFELAPANVAPKGVEHVGGGLYVPDYYGHVFVYRTDGALEGDSGFAMDLVESEPTRCPIGSAQCSSRTYALDSMTHANGLLFVLETLQHNRDTRTSGSSSYTDHVRAYTVQGERVPDQDFELHRGVGFNDSIAFADGRFYVAKRFGRSSEAQAHSPSGERLHEHDFRFEESEAGRDGFVSLAFGKDTFYEVRSWYRRGAPVMRAYSVHGERRRDLDLELASCNRDPRGITVAGDVVYVADSGGDVHDGDCGTARVFAYSLKPAECSRSVPVQTALAAATVQIYQGPLVSVWQAGDCAGAEYSPAVTGREAAVVLRVEHPNREGPSVSMSVAGLEVAPVRRARASAGGKWATLSTHLVDGSLFRSGNTISFQTGHIVDHDSDYADGFHVPIRAASLAPLRVTFVPIRTPDDLAPVVEPAAYMEAIRDFFPVGDYRATVGPVLNLKYSGTFTPRSAAQELSRRWYREADADEFYHGVFQFSDGLCGYALTSAPVAVSAAIDSHPPHFNPCPNIHAHEIGHNLGLAHANCGGAGNVDPRYPYPNAGIGPRRGWLLSERRFIEPDSGYYDIMSYCQPNFVSDYHYDKAFTHRQRVDRPPLAHAASNGSESRELSDRRSNLPPLDDVAEAAGAARDAGSAATVVLTGIVEGDAQFSGLRLESSDKPPLAPPLDGAFTLSVLDEQGVEIHTQQLAVHAGIDGRLSVWGARFATAVMPAVVIIRDASGVIVFEERVVSATGDEVIAPLGKV